MRAGIGGRGEEGKGTRRRENSATSEVRGRGEGSQGIEKTGDYGNERERRGDRRG